MKSVGESMAIGRSFLESLQKAMRSIDKRGCEFSWTPHQSREELLESIKTPTENRLRQCQQALFLGVTIEEVNSLTGIDPWFLAQLVRLNEIASIIKDLPELAVEDLKNRKTCRFLR